MRDDVDYRKQTDEETWLTSFLTRIGIGADLGIGTGQGA